MEWFQGSGRACRTDNIAFIFFGNAICHTDKEIMRPSVLKRQIWAKNIGIFCKVNQLVEETGGCSFWPPS